jgi:hypothetical protein
MHPGNGLTDPGRRRHARYAVPAIVLAPTIPDFPVEAKDISAGGFKADLRHPPEPETLHDAVILLPGLTFEECQARVVWRERTDHVWAAGLHFLMKERERNRLEHALVALAEGPETG